VIDPRFSMPRAQTLEALRKCPGDIVVLGAGGKVGPSLTAMLQIAIDDIGDRRNVYAVSRWSDRNAAGELRTIGVGIVEADLLDRRAVADLPDAANVIFMAGQKFGTGGNPSRTWAMNTVVPMHAAERYADARIVAFSSGNVYPLTPVESGGPVETDTLGPVGEYAMSCVGRERVFEYFSERYETRVALLRLNYAIDVRYGVLLDLARKVMGGETIPLGMGHVNIVWQGDANRIAIESLPHASSPPFVLNLTGREVHSVRELATRLGARLGREPRFAGVEQHDALLSNSSKMHALFAPPDVSIDEMIEHVASAIEQNAPMLDKPTHFEARDGRF
jgi:nucleoside-diphosphate-sugar epimerase